MAKKSVAVTVVKGKALDGVAIANSCHWQICEHSGGISDHVLYAFVHLSQPAPSTRCRTGALPRPGCPMRAWHLPTGQSIPQAAASPHRGMAKHQHAHQEGSDRPENRTGLHRNVNEALMSYLSVANPYRVGQSKIFWTTEAFVTF